MRLGCYQRAVAQLGSAPALGAGGREFESRLPDHREVLRRCSCSGGGLQAGVCPEYRWPMASIEVTGVLQKRAWEEKVLPPVEQVRPGLWSIPVPMPDNPLRYVLVYVFETGTGLVMVDAGWNTDEAWQALNDGLHQAGGSIADVEAVLVTHIHPDHYGLAGRVREASGAWIGLHPADAVLLESRYSETADLIEKMTELLEASGVPLDKRPDLANASMEVRGLVFTAQPDVLFEDGQRFSFGGWDLSTIWTPGHSPGHVCLWSDQHRLLLSGDHVLPRITSNISVHSQQFPNPLGDFLDSLAKIGAFSPDEVLPAHEYRFKNLGVRIEHLVAHHEERLIEILQLLLTRGTTAWDLTRRLTWSRPFDQIQDFMQRAANGETLAHLVLLEERGLVQRSEGHPFIFTCTDAGRKLAN